MKCPVKSLTNLLELEKDMADNRRKRNCIRHAITASVMNSSSTDRNNTLCVREILKKIATNNVWASLSVSGRSGTEKVSLEHKFENIFNVITYVIEQKTTVKTRKKRKKKQKKRTIRTYDQGRAFKTVGNSTFQAIFLVFVLETL